MASKRIFQVSPGLRNYILKKKRFRSLQVDRLKNEASVMDLQAVQDQWQAARETFPRELSPPQKEVIATLKTWIQGGHAVPRVLDSLLGKHGVDVVRFCREFNEVTKDSEMLLAVEIAVYRDRTFTFTTQRGPR